MVRKYNKNRNLRESYYGKSITIGDVLDCLIDI